MTDSETPNRPDESHEDASTSQPMIGTVVEQQIDDELHESYLTYAMSTITDRALPDVRDGMKPSQRRILVAMNDLNLSPGRKHRKCAKIAGDTSGNYHPHGESVIYPTLVNMGQDWKMRVPMVDKQGNFGSIDGDPPAAMRYTEARMTHATVEMLDDIKYDTVDFLPNYDDTRLEPTVLPARFPYLLINGSSGIAVGMACSIPPHNVQEMCSAITAVLDDPELSFEDLLQLVPGPDFPTGGVIIGRRGIVDAYSAGRGRVILRGRVHQETSGNRETLVITEIPYQLMQNTLIEKIVDAAKNGRIEGISDIKNFSGKKHRTRIVVYLKRDADPDVVERQLYRFTPLQSTISIINIALDKRRPRTMGLKQMIQCWIDHRREVIRRRTEFLLREARKQAHRLEGLIFAVCDIDEVIALIRASRTRDEAIGQLMERRFRIAADHDYAPHVPTTLIEQSNSGDGTALTRVQAEAIGAMRLIQLVGLEIEKLTGEYAELLAKIEDYLSILGSEERVREMIREDCNSISERFKTPRLTGFEDAEAEEYDLGELITEHDVVVTISHQGYVKRLPLTTYREQGRGGRGVKSGNVRDDDFTERVFTGSTHDDILCFTNTGRVFRQKIYQIPEMSRGSRGRAIVNLLKLRDNEKIVAFLNVKDFEKGEDYLLFATAKGRVKRTALSDYRNIRTSGINAINLNEGDDLIGIIQTRGNDHVLLATANGMSIRFDENDARVMGRTAAGVKGIGLAADDTVVGIVGASDDVDLLTVTENGYGKRTSMSEYLVRSEDGSTRPQSRGGKGRRDIRTDQRNGRVVSIRAVHEEDSLMFISSGGMIVRIPANSISRIGRNTKGVRLVNLKDGDQVISAARVFESADETEGD
ncbi:MAG TPA: DNA gyrase subunit A [Phycisphaerales bacterium]|nr:DNA gyrase subunit A [Phycisphaerales bacterium]